MVRHPLVAAVLLAAWLVGSVPRAAAAGDNVPAPLSAAFAVAGPTLGLPGLATPALAGARGPRVAALAPSRASAPASLSLGPIVSGLPWRSGASCGGAAFATWRGRPLDVAVLYVRLRTWDDVAASLASSSFAAAVHQTPQPVVSLPMLPRSEFKQHTACATGAFDTYFRQFGKLLLQAGAGRAVVRPGWEAPVGSGAHPWGIDSPAEIPAYVGCFRHEAAALKSAAPGLMVEWSNAKRGKLAVSVLETYPGDDAVDLWGVHYYDSDAQFRTQALWDAFYGSTFHGGPQGIGRWLRAAASHGKLLGVPEWGVWNQTVGAAIADNAGYIRNMHDFFAAHAPGIAYESYFDCGDEHRLFPDSSFPQASDLYRRLWSGGERQ